jgi:hypothetical protein
MSAKTFELKFPFTFKGTEHTKFEARRPKVRDVRKFVQLLDKDSVKAMETVLGDLVEEDPLVIAEIDIEDFAPMKGWFEGFLKPIADE